MNPFIQNFKLKLIRLNTKKFTVNPNVAGDSVVGSYEKIERSLLVEQQKKTSVYAIPFIENVLFKEMGPPGRDMLLYLIYNLDKDADIIKLKTEKIKLKVNISRATMYKGIEQLISSGVICKKAAAEYWVNPFYVFNGNRIKYYETQCPECIEVIHTIEKPEV